MESIVEELRRDREAGTRRLEGDYRAGLMTLARRLCADEGDAEELVNRTFAAVVEGIDRYVEQSAFFGWMCQILANIHSTDVRRRSNRVEFADADAVATAPDDGADVRLFRDVDASLLRDAVETLPANMREAILLHYFLDMPVAKIARFLSVPNGTVMSRLHYARLALAAKLGAAARRPAAQTVLVALLLLAGLAVARGVYAWISPGAKSESKAESVEFVSLVARPEPGSPVGEAGERIEPEGGAHTESAEFAESGEGPEKDEMSPVESRTSGSANQEPTAFSPTEHESVMKTSALLASLVPVAAFAANPLNLSFSVKGYAGSSTLTNFPVLVRLSANVTNGFDYADCAADGSDIRFTDGSGTLIPHEIDTWNPSGESAIWVALPTLANGTRFSMRYGLESPTAVATGSAWSGAGYASVWHLDIDTANGYSTKDSVASYTGTVRDPHATYATGGAGIVGGAYHCESNRGVHGVKTTNAAGFAPSANGEATFSVWFRQIGGTAANGYPDRDTYDHIYWGSQYGNCGVIINSKNGSESGNGVEIDLGGYADQYKRLIVRDSTVSRPDLDTESLYDKRWHHLVVVWNGTTRTMYLDGVLQTVAQATATAVYRTPSGTVRFGSRDERNLDCVWTGELDEIRFLPAAASADWIAAEHAQVVDGAFLKVLNLSGTVIIVR